MNATEFDIYLDRLRKSLQSYAQVIGLVTLGSTVDATLRDEWSDHDFWVITTPGSQDSLLNDPGWLPDADQIAIRVCHGPHRRTLVYTNGHKVEFAVFDASEATEGKVQRYAVLIDRDKITELISSVHQDTLRDARQALGKPDGLENLCVLVWSACERHQRGEFLSARQYIDGFAVNQLLSLLVAHDVGTLHEYRDELDPRRHLERGSPKLAAELLWTAGEPVPQAAIRLLDIAWRELRVKAPTLNWEAVTLAKKWIL